MPSAHFCATYVEARERFDIAAKSRGMTLQSHVHPTARGAQGEELAIDVACMGTAGADAVLVLISGTHGAEGFCGSGAQVGLLHDDRFVHAAMASGARIVMVHALNPYGFSHLRRTNEDNIDLNRNFRNFSTPPPVNAAYAGIHDFIVPSSWPPGPEDDARLQAYVARHGMPALQAAVTGGQCDHPDGLFYGGVRPAWSNGILRQVLREEGGRCQTLGWIDFHTGLGPRGHGELIFAGGNEDDADLARTRQWWGPSVTSFVDGTSTSAPLTGVNFQAVADECPQAAYAGIALEYGTLPMLDVLNALRADQWLENTRDVPAGVHAAIKRQVRDAFYQDADDWKVMVYDQALASTMAAFAAIANASTSHSR
ncbi:MAG: M14 family metallopeptidase [Betaproteobacteria bacterium]